MEDLNHAHEHKPDEPNAGWDYAGWRRRGSHAGPFVFAVVAYMVPKILVSRSRALIDMEKADVSLVAGYGIGLAAVAVAAARCRRRRRYCYCCCSCCLG